MHHHSSHTTKKKHERVNESSAMLTNLVSLFIINTYNIIIETTQK